MITYVEKSFGLNRSWDLSNKELPWLTWKVKSVWNSTQKFEVWCPSGAFKDEIVSGDLVFYTRYLDLPLYVSRAYLLSLKFLVRGLQEKLLILRLCLEYPDSLLLPAFLLRRFYSSTFIPTTWILGLLPRLQSPHACLWSSQPEWWQCPSHTHP